MHIITIKKGDAGFFNVLLNGFSYRIHRNLTEARAVEVADEAHRQFRTLRQRSVIERV